MNPKKVLVITYYWPPSGGAGVQRWLKFVKYLPEFDIWPTVLTVDPARAEYPVLDPSLEADVAPGLDVYRTDCRGIYDLYKNLTGSKTAPYGGFANESSPGLLQKAARFVRGNFFLPDARRGWVKYAFAEACRIIEKCGIDTIITTGPPHSTHLIGLKLKKKYLLKWIVDFRDPWTTVYYNDSLYQTRWAEKINRRYEQSALDACDRLLLVADDREKLDIDSSKVVFIPNGFDDEDFAGKKPLFPDEFTICYTGTVADSYPTATLLEALTSLKGKMSFKLRFVGKVSDIKREQFKELGSAVEFIEFVPHEDVINYMLNSSILLLMVVQTANNKSLLSGKIFEYLASSIPILFLGPTDGAAANIIRQAGSGDAFDYNDSEGVRDFLLQQYQYHISQTHPQPDYDFIRQFSRKKLTGQLSKMIDLDDPEGIAGEEGW